MLKAWKDLLGSKKFWVAVVASALVGALKQFGVSDEVLYSVAGLFGLQLVGLAAQDFGKEKNVPKAP